MTNKADSAGTVPAEAGTRGLWSVPMAGETRFSWQYDSDRERLLALYQKGKDQQWDAQTRISWEMEVDPSDVLGTPDEQLGIYGSRQWDRLSGADRLVLRQHAAAWEFSQFLH